VSAVPLQASGPAATDPALAAGPGPAWHGPAHRGAMREHRAALRAGAEARNAAAPHEFRRAHREGRCECQDAPEAPKAGRCPRPDKDRFTSRQAAAYAFSRLAVWRKRQGLKPYRCPAGDHFHLGRAIKRAPLAWKAVA
jgi:hypothetical protein